MNPLPKVSFDISVSLDGFITGPDPGPEAGLGKGGEALHEWAVKLESWRSQHALEGGESTEANPDDAVLEEAFANVGAFVMGREMFDAGSGPWGEDPPFRKDVFVVTHEEREPLPKQGRTTFHFVSGVGTAVGRASDAAGGGDVLISGGADVIRQALAAGLVDEFQLHLVPVFLGGGVRLFEADGLTAGVERVRVVDSPDVTHLKYRVSK